MPADEAPDASPRWVALSVGKGTLGTWRFWDQPEHSVGVAGTLKLGTSSECKPFTCGGNMSQHLSLHESGKASEGKAKVRTGLGKSDRPGSQGGLWKRELWESD
jgi:hypothetical protein